MLTLSQTCQACSRPPRCDLAHLQVLALSHPPRGASLRKQRNQKSNTSGTCRRTGSLSPARGTQALSQFCQRGNHESDMSGTCRWPRCDSVCPSQDLRRLPQASHRRFLILGSALTRSQTCQVRAAGSAAVLLKKIAGPCVVTPRTAPPIANFAIRAAR